MMATLARGRRTREDRRWAAARRSTGLLVALVSLAAVSCGKNATTTFSTGGSGGAGTGGSSTGGAAGSGGVGGSGGATGGGGAAGGGAAGGTGGTIDVGPSVFAIEDVDHHRNRLLDTLAQRRGAADRCALWPAMTIVEKGIFLTHTDMLGHRSCMENASVPAAQMNGGKCDPSGCTCSTSSPCACPPGSEMALDHVFKYWAVNGSDTSCCSGTDCCNGGGEWHRTFFSADDKLIGYFRDIHSGLPEWADSNDFGGPHAPFTQSDETQQGSPRGQTHFWAKDSEATVLMRNGVVGVMDPHVVEIDNDYNILHDSNPEGTYSFTYGRAEYKNHWNASGKNDRGDGLPTTFLGNGAPPDISEIAKDEVWSPACGPSIDKDGVAPKSGMNGGKPGELHLGTSVTITGKGFSASGNRVHVRTRTMAVALDKASPLVLSESSGAIELELPKDIGTGEAFVYVESAGVLSNLQAVTILP
jgi:hypothetical protein